MQFSSSSAPDKTSLYQRRSVFERIGSWFSGDKPELGPCQHLLERMSTFRKRVPMKTRRVVYDVGGKKTITYWGAYVYLLNQFLDCLPSIPYVILAAGWVPALIANITVCAISSLIALMTTRAMTMIEGNQNFELRYEYVPIAQHFLGPEVALSLEIGFHVLQVLNFLAINSVSRLLDIMLLRGCGYTAGVSLYPVPQFISVASGGSLEELYTVPGTSIPALTVSLGYLLCGMVCIPLSRYNLDEGLTAQLGILAVAIVAIAVVTFSALKTVFSKISIPLLIMTFPRWLLQICKGTNSQVPTAQTMTNDDKRYTHSWAPLLERIAGMDNFHISDGALIQEVDTPAFVRDLRSSRLNSCGVCATDLCLAAAQRYQKSPLLWDPLLQHLVTAAWRAQREGPKPTLPSKWGRYEFQRTFGIFIGGYSFTNMVPSWANELQADVQVSQALHHAEIPVVVWRSTISACILFFNFGWLLAYAFPDISDEDALQYIVRSHALPSFVAFSVYSLELVTIALGVVVNCVATRYNLTNSGVFRSSSGAFFFGCVCPFLFAWIFAVESWLRTCLGWASLILSLTCNFVAPAYVYIVASQTSPLAYRNSLRNKTVRLGIEAFVPHRGSVFDVQSALREWAFTMTDRDPELQALLESSDSGSTEISIMNFPATDRKTLSPRRPPAPKSTFSLIKGSSPAPTMCVRMQIEKDEKMKDSVPGRCIRWSDPTIYQFNSSALTEDSQAISDRGQGAATTFTNLAKSRKKTFSSRRLADCTTLNQPKSFFEVAEFKEKTSRSSGSSSYSTSRHSNRVCSFCPSTGSASICYLSDLRRMYTVTRIVASHQNSKKKKHSLYVSNAKPSCCYVNNSIRVDRKSNYNLRSPSRRHSFRQLTSSRFQIHEKGRRQIIACEWDRLIKEYERKLALGHLDYSSDESSSTDDVQCISPSQNNTKKNNDNYITQQIDWKHENIYCKKIRKSFGSNNNWFTLNESPLSCSVQSITRVVEKEPLRKHSTMLNTEGTESTWRQCEVPSGLEESNISKYYERHDNEATSLSSRGQRRFFTQPFLMTPDLIKVLKMRHSDKRPRSHSEVVSSAVCMQFNLSTFLRSSSHIYAIRQILTTLTTEFYLSIALLFSNMIKFHTFAHIVGSIFGSLGVVCSAYGFHNIANEYFKSWTQATSLQLIHSVAILVYAHSTAIEGTPMSLDEEVTNKGFDVRRFIKKHHLPAIFFMFGVLSFSGSIYWYILTNSNPSLVTPVGGVVLASGWALWSVGH